MEIDENLNNIGIYKIVCLKTGKFYLGSTTKSFKYRFRKHRQRLRYNYHENSYLQNAWNKYGEENFSFVIVESISNLDEIKQREKYYLSDIFTKNNKARRKICFNLTNNVGGGNTLQDEETKKIHSENVKKSYTPELRLSRRNEIKKRLSEIKKTLTQTMKTKEWKENHLNGVRKLSKDEKWIENHKKMVKKLMKPVKNNLGEVFESVTEASKFVNRSRANIRISIKKHTPCANRYWSYM